MHPYFIIGFLVTLCFSVYYRLIKKTKALQTDALFAVLGILIWPIQIIMFIGDKFKK